MTLHQPREELRKARESMGLTQKDLADLIGRCSKSTVSMWETGQSSPGFSMMKRVARELGVKPEEIWPEMREDGGDSDQSA